MTKDGALKLALNWLESGNFVYPTELRTAIKEALAQEQEPVAWIHNFIEGGISLGKRPAGLARHPDRWTALYKDPKPCPTCEALARTVMLDQTSYDTTPPQRQPLPAHEIVTMYEESPTSDSDMIAFARAIEAAHGIRSKT